MRPHPEDTIVAIATAIGEAGLGVVRLSGPAAISIASRLFSSPTLASASSHTLHHGWLSRQGLRLDDAVAGLFRTPRSYTGEDVVEFSCHGSPAVLRELLDWCQAEGARLARPGEFTERAYLNGKIDLAQAEAVALLISARSSRAARAAADQLSGGLSTRVADIRGGLIDLLARIEANLDFAEEAIPPVSRERMSADIKALGAALDELLATGAKGRRLRDGVRVVLAGRPNVGKSSIFNSLLAEDRAIVTDVPGTTRDTLEEQVQWKGHPVTLIDTAGLREGADAVERIGAERARLAQARADVAVLVIDASQGITDDDVRISRELEGRRVVAALNKTDRGNHCAGIERLNVLAAVPTSAVTREGFEGLRDAVLNALPNDPDGADAGVVVTSERHAERLGAARDRMASALQAAAEGRSEEALASDLRAAAGELAAITGEDVGEAVLDSIFSQFCIGK